MRWSGKSSVTVGLLAIATVLAVAGPATAASSIELRQVAGPAYAHASGPVRMSIDVRADRAAAASRLSVFLSANRKPDAKDPRFEGSLAVPALDAGESFEATGVLDTPSQVKPGSYFVIGCPGEGRIPAAQGCVAASAPTRVTDVAVTTKDLVEAAVSRHEISAEQGLAYRVLAAFGDSRVPAKYVGDDGLVGDDSVMVEALEAWPELSAGVRKMIAPFFSPPAAKGSWAEGGAAETEAAVHGSAGDEAPSCTSNQLTSMKWDSVATSNGKVKIWWREGPSAAASRAKAIAFKGEIDRVIWPRLSALFAPRAPLSDAKVQCFNGGDGRLDIYFIKPDRGNALTIAYPPRCDDTPVFMVVSSDIDEWDLAHEMTHAFQFAYPYKAACSDYLWFDEGSANWGGHYVYPTDDSEHTWQWMLEHPWNPLPIESYTSWVFDLYLEKVYGARLIPQIYNAFGKAASLSAIDAAVRGGFERIWPEFTRYGWNQEPLNRSFRQWDRVTEVPLAGPGRPLPVIQLALGGLKERTANLPADLQPLSRAYKKLVVVDKENVRYLKFKNTLAGVPHASVQAFVKFDDGTWETQDWSSRSTVEFCRDNATEQVSELVIMYANTDPAGQATIKPAQQPTMVIRDACDTLPYYYRVASLTFEENSSGSQAAPAYCASVSPGIHSGTMTWTGELPAPSTGAPDGYVQQYGNTVWGGVTAPLPAGSAYFRNLSFSGCKFDYAVQRYVGCSETFADYPLRAPTSWSVRFDYNVGDQKALVSWPSADQRPEVGYLDTTDSDSNDWCNVYFGISVPRETYYQYVSVDQLKQPSFTLTSSGSVHADKDWYGAPVDFTYSWSYTMTLERVAEDGGPVQ